MKSNRRDFIRYSALTMAGLAAAGNMKAMRVPAGEAFSQENAGTAKELFFKISLAEWSFNRSLFARKMNHLDFPKRAKNDFGIHGVEYVSTFFKSSDPSYLSELLKITRDLDVINVLIMVDGEGNFGDSNPEERKKAVEKHKRWVDAAKYLGCHSIRVNARGKGTAEEVAKAAIDGLSMMTEYGKSQGINIIVENHGEYSSNAQWLSGVIKAVNSPFCGTLPDLGNFRISATEEYDRYIGVAELMPYAKGVSAKTNGFDAQGNEVKIDYFKMLKIVKDAGYHNWIGIEFEGTLPEDEGILATKKLLERAGTAV